MVFFSCIVATEGRYLPTRSDDSRKEEIREILREILENQMDRKDFSKRFLIRRSTDAEGPSPIDNYESS